MNDNNIELVVAFTSSGAEELSKMIPKARVVLAFNTMPSEVLFSINEAKSKANRPSMVYCGDDRGANELAAGLISDVGFDPVDVGPLRIARYIERLRSYRKLAYEGEEGPELAYHFERFGK